MFVFGRSCFLLLVVVTAVGAGCLDVDVPDNDGLLLTCDDDGDCPQPLICDVGFCRSRSSERIDLALVEDRVDVELVGAPFVARAAPLTVTFTLNAAPRDLPVVRLVDGVDDVLRADAVVVDDDEHRYVARFDVTGDEAEGVTRVVVDVVDVRGQPSTLSGDSRVTFDFTPPTPVAVSLQRLPNPVRSPVALDIADKTDVGPGVDVRVVFGTDEDVVLDGDGAPAVRSSGAVDLTFVRDPASANPLIFTLQWPEVVVPGALDGNHDLVVVLTDLAGNRGEVAVDVVDSDGDGSADSGLVVDTVAPAAPAVDVAEQIVFRRAPWGHLDRAERDLFDVSGADDAVEGNAIVLVARDAAFAVEIGRVRADPRGAFDATDLAIADAATVFVRAADDAGNVGEARAVRDIVWTATPLDKRVGSNDENPHSFHALPIFATHLQQGGADEVGDDDGIGRADDDDVDTIGAGTWRRTDVAPASLSTGLGRLTADAIFAADPLHGTALLLGRVSVAARNGFIGFFAEAACGQRLADVKVRGIDGRWRTGPAVPEALSAIFANRVAATFVPTLGAIVVVGRDGQTFTFDSTAWRQVCSTGCVVDDTADGAAFAVPDGIASTTYDRRRRVLVAASVDGEVLELDPRASPLRWHRRGVRVAADAQVYFDEGDDDDEDDDDDGAIVFFGNGDDLRRWDGSTLTSLCTGTCATNAPVRPASRVAYDRDRRRLVLFGGDSTRPCNYNVASDFAASQGLSAPSIPPPADTWTFDGTTWTRHDGGGPPGRTRHAVQWDAGQRRVVVIGGDDCDCMRSSSGGLTDMQDGYPDDFWSWDGATWTALVEPASPSTFSFDPVTLPGVRDHVVTEAPGFDGVAFASGDRFFVFKDDAWFESRLDSAQVSPLAAVATAPDGRIHVAGGAFTSFSAIGAAGQAPVRVLDGPRLLDACDGDDPTCGRAFYGAAAWHDGTRFFVHGGVSDTVVLVPNNAVGTGGVPATQARDVLLSWSPLEGWVERCTSVSCSSLRPGPRFMHRTVVDSTGDVVLFGGTTTSGQTSNETWRWDGAAWATVDGAAPPARTGHLFAHDASRDVVVVAYGSDRSGEARFFDQFSGPRPQQPREIPAALSEVWELGDDGWSIAPHADVEGDGRPAPRSSVSGAGLPGGGVVLVGGTLAPDHAPADSATEDTTRSNESWRWDGGADHRPAHRFSVRFAEQISRYRDVDEVGGLTMRWRSTATRTSSTSAAAVRLWWWDGDGWVRVDDVETCGSDCISGHLDAGEARRAIDNVVDATIVVAVSTDDDNGPAPGRMLLRSDAVDVDVQWRRPAE